MSNSLLFYTYMMVNQHNNRYQLLPNTWVEVYADSLYAYAMTRVNNVATAEDIVQETLLSAWRARSTYNGLASEKNWLYAICKNKIIDHFRKQRSRPVIDSNAEEAMYFDDAEHWTAAAAPNEWGIDYTVPIETKEFYRILDACKNKLKDLQQQVFVLKYLEEIDADTICKVLDITASNYWVLIHRAKLHLRKCLEKNWLPSEKSA